MTEKSMVIDNVKLEKVSGGSLEHQHHGFRVFNSSTGEDFGTYENYDDAVKEAKKHKISAMGTWGDNEVPCGLVGTGFTREDVRLREDRTNKANPIFGTGSFEK